MSPNPDSLIKTIRQSFIGAEQVYMQGSCCSFYLILKLVYPSAKPYWSGKSKHMITKIGKKYYDITGEVKCTADFKLDGKEEYGSVSVAVAIPNSRLKRLRFTTHRKL